MITVINNYSKSRIVLTIVLLGFLISLLPISPLFSQANKQYQNQHQKTQIKGVIKNMTGAKTNSILTIELFKLATGMQLIKKIKPIGKSFVFSSVKKINSPYLIRGLYQGASYTILIPPSERFWKAKQVLKIYESGANIKDIHISSALYVIKKKDGLSIEEIFNIQNKSFPPRSFPMEKILFNIPVNATGVKSSINYIHTYKVPIPLEVKRHKDGSFFDHGLKPANSILTLRYNINGYKLRHKPWEIRENNAVKYSNPSVEAILIWRPANAVPIVKGASHSKVNIPGVGSAYKINYKNKGYTDLNFKEGDIVILDPIKSDINPVLDTPVKTIIVLLFTLMCIIGISRVVSYRQREKLD